MTTQPTVKIIHYANRKLYIAKGGPKDFKTGYITLKRVIDLVRGGYTIQCYSVSHNRDYTLELLQSALKMKLTLEPQFSDPAAVTAQLQA
jgi:polyhydroxyalkanoate synthesis regulator protein